MFYHSSIGATANLLLSAQRNTFSLTSSTCKKLNNDERSVTKMMKVFFFIAFLTYAMEMSHQNPAQHRL